jgi:hypothetical protein
MTRQQEAAKAVEWHKQQEARGEVEWSCPMYDGEDNGPASRRCWLQPGHQSKCLHKEAVLRIARGVLP